MGLIYLFNSLSHDSYYAQQDDEIGSKYNWNNFGRSERETSAVI